MRRPLSDAEVIGASVGVIAALVVAGLLGAVRAEVSQANAGLALVLVIVAAAYVGGRWAGGATALAAAVSFDFFLTRPYGSLAIKSSDDVVTTVLLFVVGIAVGQIAASRWTAQAAGKAGTEEVAGLYRVASLTAEGRPMPEIVDAVEHEVAEVLLLASCRFQLLPPDPALPELEASGRVEAPYVHVGDGFALPREGVAIAVRSAGRIAGWLVCVPRDELTGVSRDRRRTAIVFADHLGLALAQADTGAT